MEIRNRTELAVKKDDKEFLFVCSNDASLGNVFDALTEMRSYVFSKLQEVMDAEKKEKPVEESPAPVAE